MVACTSSKLTGFSSALFPKLSVVPYATPPLRRIIHSIEGTALRQDNLIPLPFDDICKTLKLWRRTLTAFSTIGHSDCLCNSPRKRKRVAYCLLIGGQPESGTELGAPARDVPGNSVMISDEEKPVGEFGRAEIPPNPEGDVSLSADGKWFVDDYRKDKKGLLRHHSSVGRRALSHTSH